MAPKSWSHQGATTVHVRLSANQSHHGPGDRRDVVYIFNCSCKATTKCVRVFHSLTNLCLDMSAAGRGHAKHVYMYPILVHVHVHCAMKRNVPDLCNQLQQLSQQSTVFLLPQCTTRVLCKTARDQLHLRCNDKTET